MAPKISYTKSTLSYPLYAADWAPYANYLVVGGGGGQGNHGIKNKITVLDASSRSTLNEVAEIDLGNAEDSPTCLGVLGSKDGLIINAGINSAEKTLKAGRNEHFRAFEARIPAPKAADSPAQGTITLLSRSQLFSPATVSKVEAYQRVLRLSRAQRKPGAASKRIGAIASAFGDGNELLVFDATASAPNEDEIIQRIRLPESAEANDVDLLHASAEEADFLVAYATDSEVFLSSISYDFSKRISAKPVQDPRSIYDLPYPDVFASPGRPKFRALRFLTPHHILLLSNLPKRGGAELSILRISPEGGPGIVTLRKRLPGHVKQAVSLDVCPLDADKTTGEQQFAVCVAGQDLSVCVYTIDYRGSSRDVMGTFQKITTIKDAHQLQITKALFAPFHSPWPQTSATSEKKNAKPRKPGQQYLRLASISVGNTAVVDFIPLRPVSKSPRSRYVVAASSQATQALNLGFSTLAISFVLLVSLILLQSFLDAKTETGIQLFPGAVRSTLQTFNSPSNPDASTTQRLRDLLHLHSSDQQHAGKAIILRDKHELQTEVYSGPEELLKRETEARRWEELEKHEQEAWKAKLSKAGHWAVEEGETVLKGVFFGQIAGVVGQAVRGALA